MEGDPKNVSQIRNLETYMPKKLTRYYTSGATLENRGERQDMDLVVKLLNDTDAYQEFVRSVLPHITGIATMNRMCQDNVAYDAVISISDEAFGLLLLEDKSLLWREVARLRMQRPYCNGNKSLGMKVEMKIKDSYGDYLTLYSNGGILSPTVKKGWSDKGIDRYNELFDKIKEFRSSDVGISALIEQRRLWMKDTRSARKRYKRTICANRHRAEGRGAGTMTVRCEGWD